MVGENRKIGWKIGWKIGSENRVGPKEAIDLQDALKKVIHK